MLVLRAGGLATEPLDRSEVSSPMDDTGQAEQSSDIDPNVRQWSMFLHFSLLASLVIPIAGIVVPIIIWQIKKVEMPLIDTHGKIVVNWIISVVIYGAVSIVLSFVFIGIPMLIALGVLCIVFPILGGIKANNGEVWKYPLSINFLKWDSDQNTQIQ